MISGMLKVPTRLESPYHLLGLWRNPFGELTRAERCELAVVNVDRYVEFLCDESRPILQFVGGCGFGKTTRLLAIRRALARRLGQDVPYVYFPETTWWGRTKDPRLAWPALPRRGPLHPIVVDELQRCRRQQMNSILKSQGPILVGSHVDYSGRWIRAGFDLWSENVEHLREIPILQKALNRRIEASRSSEAELVSEYRCPTLCESAVQLLAKKHQFNLRSIENCLYDEIQACIRERRRWQPAT